MEKTTKEFIYLCVCVCLFVDLDRQALLTAQAMLSSGYWERRRQILNSCLVDRDEARDCAWRDTCHAPIHHSDYTHTHVNKVVRADETLVLTVGSFVLRRPCVRFSRCSAASVGTLGLWQKISRG